MALEFHTLDVFTDRRFAGNSLAVVLGADAVDADRMQAIAREFNTAETVFLLHPSNPAHSARVRIFTPTRELPFAGHPTLGTAILLAELKLEGQQGDHDALVMLEQAIGVVRVGVRVRGGQVTFAEFDSPRLPEAPGTFASIKQIGAALGLLPGEIGFANHKPIRYSAGTSFAFVPVATLEAIGRAQVRPSEWHKAFGDGQGLVGAYLYCRETIHKDASFHARMFAPDFGIPEDPATGSAAAALAGVIMRFDTLPDGQHKRVIEQGYEMGRPSEVVLSLDVVRGALHTVRIGGAAVRVMRGQIYV